MKQIRLTRREFVRNTSILTGGLFAAPLFAKQNFFPSGTEDIKIALIGCGGRGTGAAVQALSVKANTKLVAMADAFADNVEECYKKLMTPDADSKTDVRARVQVPEENKFHGFDAYKKAIALADVVILTRRQASVRFILKKQFGKESTFLWKNPSQLTPLASKKCSKWQKLQKLKNSMSSSVCNVIISVHIVKL